MAEDRQTDSVAHGAASTSPVNQYLAPEPTSMPDEYWQRAARAKSTIPPQRSWLGRLASELFDTFLSW